MTHKIKFPIGDWSDDGHGKCDWFVVKSNKPLKDLIKAHFDFKNKAGFDIGEMCASYQDNVLKGKIAKFVIDLKVLDDSSTTKDEFEVLDHDGDYPNGFNITMLKDFSENGQLSILSNETLLKIWLACLRYADDSLELMIIPDDEIPSMINWSVKEVGLTGFLNTPGYGMFQ